MGIFYFSTRIGLHGKPFRMVKFRTMRPDQDGGCPTAASDDMRLTRIGRFLRRTKLDELSTIWNVLKGDMRLVGPRPDVPSEMETLDLDTYWWTVSVKPGLISPATLWNLNEDDTLEGKDDPHEWYCKHIKPTKYRLNVWYAKNRTWWLDIKILYCFMLRLIGVKRNVIEVNELR